MAIDIDQSFYHTGTATVANGSTSVTGQGTLWTQTCRAGDLFGTHMGDGTRILSIESNTSLTLAYPWQGASQTAADYEIQFTPYDTGYQAAVRQLLVLLTSGNIESFGQLVGYAGGVPVFTGAGTLELVNKSEFGPEDTYGNLSELAAIAKQNNQFIIMGADGSIQLMAIDDVTNAIATNTSDIATNTADIATNTSDIATNTADIATNTSDIATLQNGKFDKPTGTVNQFVRGNGTLQSVVGTVTQAAGGAIIQRGSNANGEFVRYADGTQICWQSIETETTDAVIGPLFMAPFVNWIFPSAFHSTPVFGGSCRKVSGGGVTMLGGPLGTPTEVNVNNIRAVSTHSDSIAVIYVLAIGRWF